MAANPLAAIPSLFGRFLGNAISEAAGFAMGSATSDVLRPQLQSLKNSQNQDNPHIPPDAGAMADGVAKNKVAASTGSFYAKQSGIGDDQFTQLVNVATEYPDVAVLIDLDRRGLLTGTTLAAAIQFLGYTAEFAGYVAGLTVALYDLPSLANGLQQGFVPNNGILPDAPNVGAATVIQNAAIDIDPVAEAAKLGYGPDHLKLAADLAGLPPGPELLQTWVRRGAISEQDLVDGVRQGHTKTEWAQKYLDTLDQVLGHNDFVAARVRGWIDTAAMNAGGALTGYSSDQMNTLFQNHGRPLSWHQVWIGLARGGKMLDPTADLTAASTGIDPAFFKSLQESDIRQEWYDLAWHSRYTYPAAFILRTLTQDGDITGAQANDILVWEGWEPTLAATVSAKWAGGTGTTAAQKKQTLSHLTAEYLAGSLSKDALTTVLTTSLGYTAQQAADEIALAEFTASKAARTKATNAIGKRVVALQLSAADATTALEQMGWPAGAVTNFVNAWTEERNAQLTTLTVAQIAAALKAGALLASQATPLLQDLGEDANAIATIIATAGANPAT